MQSKKAKKRRSNYVDQPIVSDRGRVSNYEAVDYVGKLSEKDRKWLKKFEREYYYNRGTSKKDKPLHKTKKLRSKLFAQNRAAGEEIGSILVTDKADKLERLSGEVEDALIDWIDSGSDGNAS